MTEADGDKVHFKFKVLCSVKCTFVWCTKVVIKANFHFFYSKTLKISNVLESQCLKISKQKDLHNYKRFKKLQDSIKKV